MKIRGGYLKGMLWDLHEIMHINRINRGLAGGKWLIRSVLILMHTTG